MRIANNALYSLAQLGLARIASVVTLIALARTQGPAIVGLFSLAITFHLILTGWWTGLDDKAVRNIAYVRANAPDTARTATWNTVVDYLYVRTVVGAALLVAVVAVVLFGGWLDPVESWVINLFALSTISDNAILVLIAGYAGNERFSVALLIVAMQAVLRLGMTAVILLVVPGMINLAVAWLAVSVLTAITALALFVAHYHPQSRTTPAPPRSLWSIVQQVRRDWSFWVLGVVVILEYQLDIILLSLFRSAAEVGYYSAATTFFALITLPVQAFRIAIYPAMSRAAAYDAVGHSSEWGYNSQRMRRMYDWAVAGVLSLVLPCALFGFFFAEPAVRQVFGEDMMAAVLPTQILMIVVIFFGLNVPHSRYLLATSQQNKAARFIVVSAVVNVLANIWLGQIIGAPGAAIARGISTLTFLVLAYLSVRGSVAWRGWRLIVPPAIASLVTGAFLIASTSWLWWMSAAVGLLLYTGAWLTTGGLTTVRALRAA